MGVGVEDSWTIIIAGVGWMKFFYLIHQNRIQRNLSVLGWYHPFETNNRPKMTLRSKESTIKYSNDQQNTSSLSVKSSDAFNKSINKYLITSKK